MWGREKNELKKPKSSGRSSNSDGGGDKRSGNSSNAGPRAEGFSPARFLAPEVLAGINSLELLARAVVEGFVAGLHRSPYTGFSTEFAEYRQYLPGDDLRHLDWRLLGRTDRYFIKKYRADTNTQCHLVIDTSASMRYTTGQVTKLQYAQFLAASLAYLVSRQQDAVGLIAFDKEVRAHIPARNRSGHMQTVYGRMAGLESGGETDLASMLHETAKRLTRRGVVILISDMYDEPERVISSLQHLRFKGNDIIVFHVLDQNEIKFEFSDMVLLEDVETAEQMPVQPEAFADGYRAAIEGHVKQLRELMAANRIDYELLTTDQPLDKALFAFLSKRAKQ